ncbi:MAG TPA: TolC family protein [Candidatus Hydrogenedentes bacterium]|nr:TolC family protein [Candidatus Hydrogenedentota bacterium]
MRPISVSVPEGDDASLPITCDGALLTALMHNRAIEVARWGPAIGETFVPEARAAFDPALLSSVAWEKGDSQRASASSVSSGSANVSSVSTTSGGVAPALEDAIDVLTALRRLAALEARRDRPVARAEETVGSIAIRQRFPTGSSVTVSGGVTASTNSATGDDNLGHWTVEVQQALLRGAPLAVNLVTLRQARNRAAQSEHAFCAAVLAVTHRVEKAYWDLALAKETLAIRRFGVALAEEQLARQRDLFSVGRAIEGDVMAARAEEASRRADLVDAEANLRQRTIALIHLLGVEDAGRWRMTLDPQDMPDVSPVEVDPDISERLALRYRPELVQAELEAANLALDVQRAANDLLPQLDLVASYGRTSRGDETSDATRFLGSSRFEQYRVGVQLQTPILNRAERARYRRADLLREQGDRLVSSIESALAAEVRQAAIHVDRLQERIRATQEALKNRVEQLRVALDRNSVGKTTNLDVLLVQRDLIQARVEEVSARVSYVEALTDLYAAEGTLLARRGISLDYVQKAGSAPPPEATPE